jgi:predicted permease
METLFKDIRYAIRSLLKHPAFTAIVVTTLTLGIGANTAIFTVVDAVMLRPLHVKDPQQLVFLSNPNRQGVNGGQETGNRFLFSYHEFEWLRDQNQVFAGIFAVQSALSATPVAVVRANQTGETEHARISPVSGAYFSVLGVNAARGRTFTDEIDKVRGANPVAVISYSYWKNRFALDPAILSRRIRVRQTSFEIIGVAPPEFSGETVGNAPDLWVPLTMETEVPKEVLAPPKDVRNKYMWLQVMARLKPGVTLEQAQASINLTLQQKLQSEASQLSAEERPGYLNQRIALVPGSRGASTLRNSFGKPLLILMGLVGLVLLIACANVANLLLARSSMREKEIALRAALGAGRRRLMQQLLTESAVLALLGGGLGLVLAQWADALLLQLVSSEATPVPLDLHPDARILGFTLGVSVLTGILFGVAPAFRAARVDLNSVLKGNAKGTVGGAARKGRVSAGKILVVGQVALSVVLLIVAGLFVHSFQKLMQIEPGYDSNHLLQFAIGPSPDNYKGSPDQLHKEVLERIRAIPGVRSASLSLSGLFSNINFGMSISIDGYMPAPGQQMGASNDYVGPSYFSTAGIPVLLGREVEPQDEGKAPLVGVINQTMARTYFGDANPIGHRIRASSPPMTLDFVVVGIVADSKHDGLRTPTGSWFYTPFFHASRDPNFSWAINEVRISGNMAAVATAIRAAVKDRAPLLDTLEIHTINELVDRTIGTERMITSLSSVFGLVAMLLACIGLYGVMSYNVAGRTNEIGIRMALGAQGPDVLKLVVKNGMTLALIGIAVGLAGAFASTHLMTTLLFEVSPTDAVTYAIVSVSLLAAALLACYIPARRATKVDPLIALRYE